MARGEDYDRDGAFQAQSAAYLESVHLRHVHVQHHQVGVFVGGARQGLLAVAGCHNHKVFALQREFQDGQQVRIIVGNEYFQWSVVVHVGAAEGAKGAHDETPLVGPVNQKATPWPGLLAIVHWPCTGPRGASIQMGRLDRIPADGSYSAGDMRPFPREPLRGASSCILRPNVRPKRPSNVRAAALNIRTRRPAPTMNAG
ncbi:MAG: hypothetical protein WKH64_03135, partial [Chloroflexia bacterium]